MRDDGNFEFSVLIPVYNTKPQFLRDCLDSLLNQDYPYWEACLVDDASTSEGTLDVLNHYSHHDSRFRVQLSEDNGGIAAASDAALAMATGDFVVLLDHDDMISLDALGVVNHTLRVQPFLDVLYSDEDKFRQPGSYYDPFYKPGWSPEALLSQMYVGHLGVYRTTLVREVGGFRPGFDGSQDWDLALRVTEQTEHVHHINRTLYHWRAHSESTAFSVDTKPYTFESGRRAVNSALERRGLAAHAEEIPELPLFVIRHDLDRPPLVSVVIPTAGGYRTIRGERRRLIDITLRTLAEGTAYRNVEIIVVLSPGTDPELAEELRPLAGDLPVTFVPTTGVFSFSGAINRGAAHATGSLLLLLNDDVEAIDDQWLSLLVETMQFPGVGAVGPRLLFEDGTIQHAGVQHQDELPFHLQRGQKNGQGYFGEVALTRNYLAVTGACMLTPTALFAEVGGLSPLFPMNYNDIDYCLKVVSEGHRIVYVGQSQLFHFESSSRSPTVTTVEIDAWKRHWADMVRVDPFYVRPRV